MEIKRWSDKKKKKKRKTTVWKAGGYDMAR